MLRDPGDSFRLDRRTLGSGGVLEKIEQSGTRRALRRWLVAFAIASICATGPAAAAPPTVAEIPPGSGLHGHPYDAVPATPIIPGAPFIDLAADGYVEREFKMSGGATVYR